MTNHTVDSCFKKYGYPPYWKQDGTINHYAVVPDKTNASQNDFNGDNDKVQGNFAFTPDQHKAYRPFFKEPHHQHLLRLTT